MWIGPDSFSAARETPNLKACTRREWNPERPLSVNPNSAPASVCYAVVRCGSCLAGRPTVGSPQLIDGASYGPEALKVIGQAFDEAWRDIAGNFGDDSPDVERARNRLARAILSIAHDDTRDVGALRRAALERMALDYKRRANPGF